MIPQNFIDEVLSRTDIVEIIRARVQLKQAGRDWTACCPFHDEKTPSFTVSPAKQFYHCFGCGEHGNALGFLMAFDRLEFPAAVEQLARQAGLQMPSDEQEARSDRSAPLYRALAEAQTAFSSALKPGTVAHGYLEERGVDQTMREVFGIGFAPPGWSFLADRIKDKRSAEAAGLLVRKEGGSHYDRFRCRLTFPIRDLRGRVVGFGGRALDDDKAKYLNSPETPVFHKGRLVYGLFEARQANRQLERLLVVEGYMDVIALAQFGLPIAVATLGTATTPEHVQLLLRQTRRIVFCFDGDAAGRRAAHKALDVALAEFRDGVDMRFLFLPEGEDPDTLVRKEGGEAFGERIDNAMPLSELLLERLGDGLDLGTAEGQAGLMSRLRESLEAVRAPAFKELLQSRVEGLTKLSSPRLGQLLGRDERPRRRRQPVEPPQRMTPVRRAIALLLHYPAVVTEQAPVDALTELATPGADLLAALIQLCLDHEQAHCGFLIERYRDRPEQLHLQRLALVPVEIDEDTARTEFAALCERMIADDPGFEARLRELSQRPPEQLNEAERAELARLIRKR